MAKDDPTLTEALAAVLMRLSFCLFRQHRSAEALQAFTIYVEGRIPTP